MTLLDIYPKTQESAVSVVRQNMIEAEDDWHKAQIVADAAFERFQDASPDKQSELRREAEKAQDYADVAKLDYQQAKFVWESFWN